jgi:hypothetical protein
LKVEKPSSNWTYETITSGTPSSAPDDSTDRDRSAERTIVPTRPDADRYGGGAGGLQQSLLDQNRTTTTTTRTTRRFGHGGTGQQQQQTGGSSSRREQRGGSSSRREETAITSNVPEIDEKFLQSKIHITRKYKGKRRFFSRFFLFKSLL